jgi:hypothetical protein
VLAVSTTAWWAIGYAVGVVVVVAVASLLLAIIVLGRRIARQAGEIVAALDGARANTTPLFDVTRSNLALDRITRSLRAVREGLSG